MENKYLTIQQAAKMLGVTELTLRNWDKSGKFLASRHPINNYRIYTTDQVNGLIEQIGTKKRAPTPVTPPPPIPRGPKKLSVQFIDDDAPENPIADLL